MKFLKDLLFPKVCLNCGLLGSHICLICQKKLKKVEKDTCFYCKKPNFLGLTHVGCKKGNGVDGAISVFLYSDVLKKILKNIKYRLTREGLEELLSIIPQDAIAKLDRYKRLYHNFVIEPIPLFRKRKRQRGFNQSEEIVTFLSRHFDYPRASNLVRIRETLAQSRLPTPLARSQNIKGAFKIDEKNTRIDKRILLVDDVVTTGATLSEAATVLKRSGVEKVFVFTLAKG